MKPDLNLGSQGCHHEKNFTTWIWPWDPCISRKYFITGPSKQIPKVHTLVPFRTTKDSFLPVTFTGLADLFPQLGSSHGQLCGDAMYLALVVQCQNIYNWCRGRGVQILGEKFDIFSCWHPWETRFKSDFHSSFWDFICEIWKWGMASSFWNHAIQISIRQVHFQDSE